MKTRICFIGDSFVNGTGDPDCLGWTGRLCKSAITQGHDITYYNLGIRRETSSDIQSRWKDEVTQRLPHDVDGRVVFSFGVNDTTEEHGLCRVNPTDSLVNIQTILAEAKQLYPVLMIGPAPIADNPAQNHRIDELSRQFYDVCDSLQIPYLEVFHSLKRSPLWMEEAQTYDGAHPRNGGYQVFFELVESWPVWRSWFQLKT